LGKRLIMEPRATAAMRLRALEVMNDWTRDPLLRGFTPKVLELIDPASDVEMQMIHEARSLDPHPWPEGDYSTPPSFYVLSGQELAPVD
jgi:hypothetical protein